MDMFNSLPIGFSMALAQNQTALRLFGEMTLDEQQELINRSRTVRSKAEMHAIIDGMVN